ncbi:hypothetical protein L195_g022300 [Trifolium pratense]|uniref:Uncharacterized protein n=1 Tax=Trifolium pratense TaxID=57577 RepID=A0A2K3N7R5_TRIPR|nr:hypothetical protein L195_g022300 [Trifolium pratense]
MPQCPQTKAPLFFQHSSDVAAEEAANEHDVDAGAGDAPSRCDSLSDFEEDSAAAIQAG